MKILVIGGVAAGTKTAAKLKRENLDSQIIIMTKGKDISYAGCGLPYYVGGMIGSREELIVNTPEKYMGLTGTKVITECEVTKVDTANKMVYATKNDEEISETYDKLVIASGAYSFVPDIEGKNLEGVFTMRSPDDAIELTSYIDNNSCHNAVVVGAGFIGLEVAENLKAKGLSVTIIDFASQIMPNAFDTEMADYAKKQLKNAGLRVLTSTSIVSVKGDQKASGVITSNGELSADVVVFAMGIRPSTAFLADSGIEMFKGTIITDEKLRTNIPDVYAVGDCAMVNNMITNKKMWSAMGSTANIAGRVLAKAMNGKDVSYKGAMGTGVVKLLENLNAGRTGLTEAQAKAEGYDVETVLVVTDDKAHYYPDSSFFCTKLIAEKSTHKLLGIQVIGSGAVDKMVDIAVTGISAGLKLEDFDTLDFAYAPPFSTAIHPFVQACYVLENKLNGQLESITPAEYMSGKAKGYTVLDVQPAPSISGAKWINLAKVDGPIKDIDKDEKLLLVCARGKRGYFLQTRLKHYGYTNVKVLEGGVTFNTVKVELKNNTLPPEEIKRVKGLGCLQDKRYPDRFNVRVITRNGKITSAEQLAIAKAAEMYGSGEVTMTTRLTLEIQCVPYDKLEELFEFLASNGLKTGGTGSKVRPVVSCKGTTCQYGLCDTFALSQKMHEKFFEGYSSVALPHKFKIAVGGCPNNCVKPDLNDIGIVGQRLVEYDLSKCRGCKVCQVEKACPVKAASVVDGKLKIDTTICNNCGRCVTKCPFHVNDESTYGYKVFIGGRWGKRVASGQALTKIFTSEEEVMDIVEKAILFFRDEGITGERFADTIARLGFDYVNDKLINGKLDKEKIMQKTVIGGATC